MSINNYKPKESKFNAGGALMGFVTGGPMGAAASLAGDLVKGGGALVPTNIGGEKKVTQIGIDEKGNTEFPDNAVDYNPMDKKLDNMQQDPMAITHEALALLKDPSIPQEYRDQYAEPLLRYKHYGKVV